MNYLTIPDGEYKTAQQRSLMLFKYILKKGERNRRMIETTHGNVWYVSAEIDTDTVGFYTVPGVNAMIFNWNDIEYMLEINFHYWMDTDMFISAKELIDAQFMGEFIEFIEDYRAED